MNAKKIVKFNLYMSCILLGAFVLLFVGATLAYFSDIAQTEVTFTSGNVSLTLSEAAVKKDASGNLVEDTASPRVFGAEEVVVRDFGKIYPGQSVCKDPVITNTGEKAEWIAAKVILKDGSGDLTKVMGYEGFDSIDIEVLLSGGLLDETIHFGTWNGFDHVCHNDRYAMIQIPHAASDTYEFYFLMLQPLQPGESVTVFEQLSFPKEWDNSEMQHLADLKIHVQAFGVQTLQLGSCLEAMTAAFPDHFDFT